MSNFFTKTDRIVLLRAKGIYSEHEVWSRNADKQDFAKRGNSFIKLHEGGTTSSNSTMWDETTVAPISKIKRRKKL